ncbi:hypothetical protein ACNI65_11605 [Roseateles sp. So40a]|uniref:hypothetical protein n=1 Tax=Roseateles sp. So40a TaxID=3400226 RepID=UPI003A8753A8
MRIPFTSVEAVWHRPGEPVDGVAVGNDLAHPLLPVKLRSTEDGAVARRLRAQYEARALRSQQRIALGEWPNELVATRRDGGSKAAATRAGAEALRLVRLALYDHRFGALKSYNKNRSPEPILMPSESEKAHAGDLPTAPVQCAVQSADIWQAKSHNGHDLALAALDVIAHRHPDLPTNLVTLGRDHTLVVIGHLDAATVSQPMSSWPPGLVACDPWSNLSVPAREYPERFVEKMRKWTLDGKSIRNEALEWLAPRDPQWIGIAKEVPDVWVRERMRNGQCRDVVLSCPTQATAPSSKPNASPSA